MTRRTFLPAVSVAGVLLTSGVLTAEYGSSRAPAVAATPQSVATAATAQVAEPIDVGSLDRIRSAALSLTTSRVMQIAGSLTAIHGARLTGSPGLQRAAEWTADQMRGWGLRDVALEPWPQDARQENNGFPRGWTNTKFYLAAIEPEPFPIAGTPVAWTPGTRGLLRGEATVVNATSLPDFDRYRGRLTGQWVLLGDPPTVRPLWGPLATRLSDQELDLMERPRPVRPSLAARAAARPRAPSFADTRLAFLKAEGALGIISTTGPGHGVYMIGGVNANVEPDTQLPWVVIPAEPYGRLARILSARQRVTIEADIVNAFTPNPPMFNVVGTLPGTDKTHEVVMLGAHLDAWHAAEGATDNAAGVAVVLEAMRILQATAVPLRRTVRVALWTGEEQGLFGSALYVRQHFGGDNGRPKTAEHAALSGYFNLDGGTGTIRGIFLQRNVGVGPIFRRWMESFRALGMSHLDPNDDDGTDHVSFDAAGLPAWNFIQDGIEYETLTHHTNLDTFDRLQADDLRTNAAIVASFVFLAANREEPLPRK